MNVTLSIVVIVSSYATAATTMVLDATLLHAVQPMDSFHKGTEEDISCDNEKGNNASSCNRGDLQCRDD